MTATLTHAVTSRPTATRTRLMTASLGVLCVAQLLVGTVFGSVQTGTTVLATAAGSPGLTGYFHALLGVGSVVAGLAVAGMPTRWRSSTRLRSSPSGCSCSPRPLLLVGSLAALVPVLLLLGLHHRALHDHHLHPRASAHAAVAHRCRDDGPRGATGLGYALGAALAGNLAD